MANISGHLPSVENVPSKKFYKAEVIGGVCIALISGLAFGLIFGPLAALTGICIGGIIGAYAGLKISSCFVKKESSMTELPMTPEEKDELELLLEESEKKAQESNRLNTEYNKILQNARGPV